MMTQTKTWLGALVLFALLGCGNTTKEQSKPPVDKDGHSDKLPAEPPTASGLKDAADQIDKTQQELAAIVKDGDLSKAHETAERLSKQSAQLPELATKAKLPAADVEALKTAAKTIADLFPEMDEAGDNGNRDKSNEVFAKYAAPLTVIKEKAK